MSVLSVQSSVAYGHVGNSAARPVLQALGHPVWAVDTVIFSNQPGHGRFRGRVQDPALIDDLLTGLAELSVFAQVRAVVSGYLGDAANGALVARTVAQVKQVTPAAIFVLDPVMGDFDQAGTGRLFVRPGVPETIQQDLLPLADVITPNRFELMQLAGHAIDDTAAALAAVAALRQGLERPNLAVIVTSFDGADVPADAIDSLALTNAGAWRVRQPRLARRFDGAGDTFTALALAALLEGMSLPDAVARAASAIDPILANAAQRGAKDLDLVRFLPNLRHPAHRFTAEPIHV